MDRPALPARHGGDHVADVLQANGVRFVFTLVGGHISPILAASKARGIRIVDTRTKQPPCSPPMRSRV
jgi:thiamine pyrophosphate-dependent acetolactate synthase large subunit-like protein